MSKIRMVLLSLLAVFVVSAVASATASAVMPAYTNENGSLITGQLPVLTTTVGTPKLTATLAGVKIEIQCLEVHGHGWVENNTTTGMGLDLGLLHYLKCTMPKPAGQGCKIHNELVRTELIHSLLLLHPGSGSYLIDFVPDNGANYALILIEGCTTTGINGDYLITGSARALVNNTNLTAEFNSTSGSALKLGAVPAEYTDVLKTEMLGGGGIMIEDGS